MNGLAARRAALQPHGGRIASAALVVTWSSGFIGAELSRRAAVTPFAVLGWRFVVLAILLTVVCAITRTSLRSWREWRRQAVLGLLCQAAYLAFVFEGVSQGVHGGTAALIAASQPLLVATVAGRLLGERLSPLMWVGMVIGLIGVVVVVSGDAGTSGGSPWVFALPVAGTLSLASGTVLTRRLRPSATILQSLTMQSVVTAILMMVGAAITGHAAPPTGLDAWLAIGWLLVFASLGGYFLYVFVTRTLGATVVSTLLYLTPPTTMGWAWLMFGDPVTTAGFVGLAISAVGVLLVLNSRPDTPTHTEPVVAAEATTTGPVLPPAVRPG